MKKDEITTEELENRTEDVPKIAEMNVLNATIVEMTIATVAIGNVQNATTLILLLEPNATDVESLVDNTRMVEATTGVEDSSVTIEVEDSSATTEEVKIGTEAIGNVQNATTLILHLEPNATDVENHVDGTRMEEATTEVDDSSVPKEEVRLEIIEVVTKVAGEKYSTTTIGNAQNATTRILLLEPNATDVESLVDNTRMVEATTGVEDSSVTIEVEDSSATTEEVKIGTEAIGNVQNATTLILHLEPNATDVENHVDGTRMEEATTEVDDSSVPKEEVRLEIIEVVTKVAGEKYSTTTIGNAQNATTRILLLEPNATDVESHETVETHVGKEGIQTEETHTLLANQTKGNLAERGSAHLVEMDATVEMSRIMTTETTTMVLGIMNDQHLENRENRGHLENHVAMDLAMHIIVLQNH